MMARIFPYGAIQFMAFDKSKKILSKQLGVSGHIHRPVVGAMAGMTAVICTYPLDVIRACLVYQMKGHHHYTGIRNAFQTIYLKEGGIPSFYKGLIPTLIGMTPDSTPLLRLLSQLSSRCCLEKDAVRSGAS